MASKEQRDAPPEPGPKSQTPPRRSARLQTQQERERERRQEHLPALTTESNKHTQRGRQARAKASPVQSRKREARVLQQPLNPSHSQSGPVYTQLHPVYTRPSSSQQEGVLLDRDVRAQEQLHEHVAAQERQIQAKQRRLLPAPTNFGPAQPLERSTAIQPVFNAPFEAASTIGPSSSLEAVPGMPGFGTDKDGFVWSERRPRGPGKAVAYEFEGLDLASAPAVEAHRASEAARETERAVR